MKYRKLGNTGLIVSGVALGTMQWGAPARIQKDLMGHSNLKTTLEIYGIEPDVAPAHRGAKWRC